MSFSLREVSVCEGDLIGIYLSFSKSLLVRVEAGASTGLPFGRLDHDDLIGKLYGARVYLKHGYVTILRVTPELWTEFLPHRTQIIYTPDISVIMAELDIRSGSVVAESGTGSGSLSHAVLRTIAPKGHLYTFDFHEARVETARSEFAAHGFGDMVTSQCRDVIESGYGLGRKCDALILDLPSPWLAVQHVGAALKPCGRLASFSPCIEQVQRTCAALRLAGFRSIRTVECLERRLEVKSRPLLAFDFDTDSASVVESGEQEEDMEEEVPRRRGQIQSTRKATTLDCATLPRQTNGHTGFLTFASIYR